MILVKKDVNGQQLLERCGRCQQSDKDHSTLNPF